MHYTHILLLITLVIVGLIILYKMQDNLNHIEHFESKLKRFKTHNKKKNKFGNIAKKKNKEQFKDTKNKKISVNNLLSRAKNLTVSETSFEHIKNELSKYNKSFKNEQFNDTGNATQDLVNKYTFFKNKLFEIFT